MQLIEEQKIEESHMYSFYEKWQGLGFRVLDLTLLVREDDV